MALRELLPKTTPLDRGILGLLLIGLAFSFYFFAPGERGARVVVEREGKVIYTAPLGGDRTARLQGPLGETVLQIHQGRVCILDSPCRRKVCLAMGEVSGSGEVLACVPNELLVRIEGVSAEGEGDYDLLTR